MTGKRYRSELLGRHHDRAGFSCGVEGLDRYFRQQVGQDQRRNLAAPYVLVDNETGYVAGYYTLNTFSIVPTSLPQAITKHRARYDILPAILIGRLAVDLRHRGKGVGRRLLMDALARRLEVSKTVLTMGYTIGITGQRKPFCPI